MNSKEIQDTTDTINRNADRAGRAAAQTAKDPKNPAAPVDAQPIEDQLQELADRSRSPSPVAGYRGLVVDELGNVFQHSQEHGLHIPNKWSLEGGIEPEKTDDPLPKLVSGSRSRSGL